MKKKLLSILLSLCMVLTLLPTVTIPALAVEPPAGLYVGEVQLTDGHYTTNGTAAAVNSPTKPTLDSYAWYKGNTLTLHNFSYSGAGGTYTIYDELTHVTK